jgi:hypothetical protein
MTLPIMPSRGLDPAAAYIDDENNTVTFRVPKLVQGRLISLDSFYLKFNSNEEIQNFSIIYSTSLIEHPEGINGELNIVIAAPDSEKKK